MQSDCKKDGLATHLVVAGIITDIKSGDGFIVNGSDIVEYDPTNSDRFMIRTGTVNEIIRLDQRDAVWKDVINKAVRQGLCQHHPWGYELITQARAAQQAIFNAFPQPPLNNLPIEDLKYVLCRRMNERHTADAVRENNERKCLERWSIGK